MTDLYSSEMEGDTPEIGRRHYRPQWLFLFLGLIAGLAIGLGYTWELNPVQFYNTDPVDLSPQHKETWVMMVASAYRQDGDLDRAVSRLAGLQDSNIGQTVAGFTERDILAGQSAARVRALASLADALGARTDEMMIYLATPEPTLFFTSTPPPPTPTFTPSPSPTRAPTTTPTPTRAPSATPTPSPTLTPRPTSTSRPTSTRRPTATLPPPYVLDARQRLCQPAPEKPRIEIVVQTEEGAGVPGSEIWITWSGGVDRFITGMKPEVGLGYADFDMSPDVFYAVAVGGPATPLVTRLSAEPCQPGSDASPLASWRLTIVANTSAFTPTPTVTKTPIAVPTATPSLTPIPSPSATATSTRTTTPTATRTATPTATLIPSRSPTATLTPPATATSTRVPPPSATVSRTPTPSLTSTPFPSPSSTAKSTPNPTSTSNPPLSSPTATALMPTPTQLFDIP